MSRPICSGSLRRFRREFCASVFHPPTEARGIRHRSPVRSARERSKCVGAEQLGSPFNSFGSEPALRDVLGAGCSPARGSTPESGSAASTRSQVASNFSVSCSAIKAFRSAWYRARSRFGPLRAGSSVDRRVSGVDGSVGREVLRGNVKLCKENAIGDQVRHQPPIRAARTQRRLGRLIVAGCRATGWFAQGSRDAGWLAARYWRLPKRD